jgi:uncharacterized membrane protein YoaK (UPF0700 family)
MDVGHAQPCISKRWGPGGEEAGIDAGPSTRSLLLLTFATGAIDAASFLGLGQVFAAMQTGNVIFLGIGATGAGDVPFAAPLIGLVAFLLGGSLAASVIRRRPVGEEAPWAYLPLWLMVESGLVALAAVLAATIGADPGHASAYLLIALLSLSMGLRNTFVRGVSGPNLATTVLNLTLTTVAPGSALAPAAVTDLRERTAGLGSILAGALVGALVVKSSLPLALLLAAGAILAAALTASVPRQVAVGD